MENNKLDNGIRLLCLAGMIQCAKYISAAVYMSGSDSMSRDLFENGLKYLGSRPDILSALAGFAGLTLISLYIADSINKRKGK